jgi:hypothetical protein
MSKTASRARREPTVGAAWRSRKGLFALVSLADAKRLTGHSAEELRAIPSVQAVMRIYPDGSREEALRVPSELLVRRPRPAKSASRSRG